MSEAAREMLTRQRRIEPRLLRSLTVRRVLDVLRDGPASRAEVVRRLGISAPTVSKAVASLVDAGLLDDTGPAEPHGIGRPGRRFQLARQSMRVLGIKLDADRTEIVAAGLDGGFIEGSCESFATPADYGAMLSVLERRLTPLIAGATTLGIGISAPGLMDRDQQEILLSPNMPMMNGRTPAPDLEQRLGLPCSLFQESHALCLAASAFGNARGTENFVMVDASVGLGVGAMQGGRLILGHRGLAGEIGHVTVEPGGLACGCGNDGCLETRATDAALARLVSERIGREVGIDAMIELVADDPDRFGEEIDLTTTWLSVALAAAVNIFNPAKVLLHSRWLSACPSQLQELICRTRDRALGPSVEDCAFALADVTKLQGAVAGTLHTLLHHEPPVGSSVHGP